MKPHWHYLVLPDRRIQVTDENGVHRVPQLLDGSRQAFYRLHDKIAPLVYPEAVAVGVDPADAMGIAWGENEKGDMSASDAAGGLGYFQLTSKGAKGAYSDELLRQPIFNVRRAVAFIAELYRWLAANRYPVDLVQLTATYNAGSPYFDADSVWRLHTHRCGQLEHEREHISRVVWAANTARAMATSQTDPAMPAVVVGDELGPVTIDETETTRDATWNQMARDRADHGKD